MCNPITIHVDNDNYEQQLAYDLVANTNRCLYITGKAGTVKTTFIQRIQKEIQKNFVVLAPQELPQLQPEDKRYIHFSNFLWRSLFLIPNYKYL